MHRVLAKVVLWGRSGRRIVVREHGRGRHVRGLRPKLHAALRELLLARPELGEL
jgi:hypothetical protein